MKTYYVDDMYNIIDKPNPNTAGIFIKEPFIDCEYMLAVNPKNRTRMNFKGFVEKCPNDSDYTQDCPLFRGNNPCKKALKCVLKIVESRYKPKKWKQKTLLGEEDE